MWVLLLKVVNLARVLARVAKIQRIILRARLYGIISLGKGGSSADVHKDPTNWPKPAGQPQVTTNTSTGATSSGDKIFPTPAPASKPSTKSGRRGDDDYTNLAESDAKKPKFDTSAATDLEKTQSMGS